MDTDLKIPFDTQRKLCGSCAGTKNKQEIDLFPKVNRIKVFSQQKCCVNCMDDMLKGGMFTYNV